MELEEAPAGVVEHTVQHNTDAKFVGGIKQFAKRLGAPQQRVHSVVVISVVAVVGCRLEDGVEIDGIDAQIGQIIQMFEHADEVPTLVAVYCGGAVPRFEVGGLAQGIAVCEAVREYLIEYGVLYPIRCVYVFVWHGL